MERIWVSCATYSKGALAMRDRVQHSSQRTVKFFGLLRVYFGREKGPSSKPKREGGVPGEASGSPTTALDPGLLVCLPGDKLHVNIKICFVQILD